MPHTKPVAGYYSFNLLLGLKLIHLTDDIESSVLVSNLLLTYTFFLKTENVPNPSIFILHSFLIAEAIL